MINEGQNNNNLRIPSLLIEEVDGNRLVKYLYN
jgi:hypothetical protein